MYSKSIRTSLLAALITLSTLFITACSINPAEQINGMLVNDHFTVKTVQYGRLPRQSMDVYRPKVDQGKPTVVFVYGGAWRAGTKNDFKFIGHALTQLGHAVVIPDYQLYPAVKFPVFIEDVAQAVKQAELRSENLIGRNMDEIVLMGHSAGGHTAALLYTDTSYFKRNRVNANVVGMIGLAGPYDLTLEYTEIKGVFDGAGKRSQPIDYIKPGLAPVLLLSGANDKRVLPYHSKTFSEELAINGVDVRTRYYPNTNHVMVLGSIAQPLRHINNSYGDIAAFLQMITNRGWRFQ
jgi:acetyl esterase/lipase